MGYQLKGIMVSLCCARPSSGMRSERGKSTGQRTLFPALLLLIGLSACAAQRSMQPESRSTTLLPIPPQISAGNPLMRMGYLDATLYSDLKGPNRPVDPKGIKDSTLGLQDALSDAYNYGLTLYLPQGTYLVSDTLRQDQAGQQKGCAEHIPKGNGPGGYGTPFEMRKAPAMVGQIGGARPLIVLKDNSPGFDSTNERDLKAVVYFRNIRAGEGRDTWTGNDACGFGLVFRGIDVKTGRNPGAIGLQIPAAQYSAIEDVRIDATGGYAGIRGLPGRTNSATNVEVLGGSYGIIAENGRGFNLVGVDLRGQTKASLSMRVGEALALTGFHLEPGAGGSAVEITRPNNGVFLYDGVIVMPKGSSVPMISNSRNSDFYLGDVSVQSDGMIAEKNESGQPQKGSGRLQTIKEYAYSPDPSAVAIVSNGMRATKSVKLSLTETTTISSADPGFRRPWQSIPSFQDAGVTDVTTVGAKGDGRSDDSSAIQKAIDQSPTGSVFLPRGDYLISKPLMLGLKTKLFGVPGYRSRIIADFGSDSADYAIKTAEDPAGSGSTYIGDIDVILPSDSDRKTSVGGILWRVGGSSIGRQVSVGTGWASNPTSRERQLLRISGGRAGGSWYGFIGMPTVVSQNKGFRGILVENTSGPATFYGSNTERAGGDFLVEVNRSSNVRFFGTKTETGTRSWGGTPPALRPFALIQDSSDILIGGFTGLSTTVEGRTSPSDTIQFVNSSRAVAAVIHWAKRQLATSSGALLVETHGGQKVSIPGTQYAVLFRRD